MAETQYRRLTRPRRCKGTVSVVTYSRSGLWLGNDHLLVVVSNGYSETYKRFYFQDIQAIAIRLTRRRLIWNWVLGPLLAFCLAGWSRDLLVGSHNSVARLDLGGGLHVHRRPPLLLNNLFGPTCACTLRTAVQTEELPSLCRLPKTRRILNRLRPLIAEAQGQLAPEEIPARLQAWTAAAAAKTPFEPTPADGGQTGVRPSPGAASSAAPATLQISRVHRLRMLLRPGTGALRGTAQAAPAEAKVPYVVDDPNTPPKILS